VPEEAAARVRIACHESVDDDLRAALESIAEGRPEEAEEAIRRVAVRR
jgi:hypothetical protein